MRVPRFLVDVRLKLISYKARAKEMLTGLENDGALLVSFKYSEYSNVS